MMPPQLYALFISGECNLACDYCYFPEKARNNMSAETAAKVLDFIARRKSTKTDIGFFGVEPLMNFEMIEWFLKKAPKQIENLEFSLNTNGVLLNEKRIALLQKHDVKISLSLDGADSASNCHRLDKNGREAFGFIEKNFNKLINYIPAVYVRITLTPDSAPNIGKTLEAIEQIGFKKAGFSFDFTSKFSNKQLNGFRNSLIEYTQKYTGKLIRGDTDFIVASLFGASNRNHPEKGLFCGAGKSLFSISAEGGIFPCWRYAGESDRLIGTVETGISEEALVFFNEYDNLGFQNCSNCHDVHRCARCLWVCERIAGGPYIATAEQCFFNKTMFEVGRILKRADLSFYRAKAKNNGLLVKDENGNKYMIPFDVLDEL